MGVLVKRCWKASLRLWAGSVDMISTEDRTRERRIDRIELQVVLPTPPFPPTKSHLRVSWSSMFCTVASGKSDSIFPKQISLSSSSACSFRLFFSLSVNGLNQHRNPERERNCWLIDESWSMLLSNFSQNPNSEFNLCQDVKIWAELS